jgi:hypothetical protein
VREGYFGGFPLPPETVITHARAGSTRR